MRIISSDCTTARPEMCLPCVLILDIFYKIEIFVK